MNHRSSFSSVYGSGRASPYTSRIGHDGRSLSELYEYVGPGDVIDQRGGYEGSGRGSVGGPQPPYDNEEAPDIVHVRYLANAFRVEFPPFSISESAVSTGNLRQTIALRLGQDHRRIRLLYKDRVLKKDRHPIKHYGCKQNSEVAVVITEHLTDHGDSSSGEEVAASTSLHPDHNNDRRRPRGNSSVRYRSDEFGATPDSNGLLHPLNGPSLVRRRSPSRSNGRDRSHSPAPHATTSHSPVSQTQPRHRSPPRPRADPSSPMGKVQALEDQYYDKWYPLSQAYLSTPPHDPQLREKEWRKLSESIMRHVIEAADAIELQGDKDARAERKKVLNNAQELVKRLDAVGKPK